MKKIIHFLFPRITIAITVVFFLLFFVYDGFKTAFDYTLLFFIMFMLPLDLIIAIIKGIKNWLLKNTNQIDNVYSLRKQSQHTDFQNPYVDKPTNSTAAPKKKLNKRLKQKLMLKPKPLRKLKSKLKQTLLPNKLNKNGLPLSNKQLQPSNLKRLLMLLIQTLENSILLLAEM